MSERDQVEDIVANDPEYVVRRYQYDRYRLPEDDLDPLTDVFDAKAMLGDERIKRAQSLGMSFDQALSNPLMQWIFEWFDVRAALAQQKLATVDCRDWQKILLLQNEIKTNLGIRRAVDEARAEADALTRK